MEQKYKNAAKRARNRKFPTKNLRRPVQHAFTAKPKVFYHDYYTTITIPEHVGTRSVLISMNDIMCPEVNFNSSFVVPGARFLDSDDKGFTKLLNDEDSAISRATRDYKFLFRSPDVETLSDQLCGAEVDPQKVNEVWRKSDRLWHGTMMRLTRGCYNGTYLIKPGTYPDAQYSSVNLTLYDKDGVTKSIQHHKDKTNHCSVLGTVCKGTYFIPRNGSIEHYLRRCRPVNSDPSVPTDKYLPNQEFYYKIGFDPTGIHGVNLVSNIDTNVDPGQSTDEVQNFRSRTKTIKPNLGPGSYVVGGCWHHGLGFRPCNLPSYVPSYPEVRDRTFSTMFVMDPGSTNQWETTWGNTSVPAEKNGHLRDLQEEMTGLWKELSKKDFSEVMRVIALTEAEKKELEDNSSSPLRNEVVGGTFSQRPPEEWCWNSNGVFMPPDIGVYTHGRKVKTIPNEYKRIIQMARGVTENRNDYDHHMVIGSKIDVELVDTSVKGRFLLNDNGVKIIGAHESNVTGTNAFMQDHYNLSQRGGENLGVEWGIQKVYPKNEDDLGVPTMDIAPDTHEKLPTKAELYDSEFNYCASYTVKSVRECVHDLHEDKTSATRDDMFQLKGHYVNALTGKGKTQLSAKYDMNSSIKRYREVKVDGAMKAEVPPIKKDHRYVVNHSLDQDRQEIEHTSETPGMPYSPYAQRAKNYDMREKYMPCFRIFTRRANGKVHNEVDHQTNVDVNADSLNGSYGKNISSNVTFNIRSGMTTATPGRVADELDACRLSEFNSVTNPALTANVNGVDNGIVDDTQNALTDAGIDTTKFNGVIDSTRRKEIAGNVCPAMRYRVRVRYKVYWWNDEHENAVTPYVATTKHNAQESDWRNSAMNSDILSSIKGTTQTVQDLEEDEVVFAENVSRKRDYEAKEDLDDPKIRVQDRHQIKRVYAQLQLLDNSYTNTYDFAFFEKIRVTGYLITAGLTTILTVVNPESREYVRNMIELIKATVTDNQQRWIDTRNMLNDAGLTDDVITTLLKWVFDLYTANRYNFGNVN